MDLPITRCHLTIEPITLKRRTTFLAALLISAALFIAFKAPLAGDKEKIAGLIKGTEPITWVFTGNSITQGAKHTRGMRSYPEIFSERIRWEMGRSGDHVINTAISGNTSRDILNDFDRRVTQLRPQVVSLMIGTNDAATSKNVSIPQFRENLIKLIAKIRIIGAIPVILSPNPIIVDLAPERARLHEYVEVMREVVKQQNVVFVDNYASWNNELKVQYKGEVNRHLLNDPLHPSGQGHKEFAIGMFKELSIFDPEAPTCGGEYYEGEH